MVTLIVAAIVIVGLWAAMHALRRRSEREARERTRLEADADAGQSGGEAQTSDPVSPRTG